MSALQRSCNTLLLITALLAATSANANAGAAEKMSASGKQQAAVELSGAQEVPPVSTKASGKSTITVGSDKSVSGSVTVENMAPTAAHIHQAASGSNGPVVLPLTKTSEKEFSVPPNSKFTDSQYAAFKDGNLYINVHSAQHPNGEIRVQMKP